MSDDSENSTEQLSQVALSDLSAVEGGRGIFIFTKASRVLLSWWRIHLQCRRPGLDLWVGKIPLRREQQPTPVFWPGEFHGLYSPWGCRVRHNWSDFHFTRQVERCCRTRALPLIALNPQREPGTPRSWVITILYLQQVCPSHGITEGKPDSTKSSPVSWQSGNHESKGEKTTKVAHVWQAASPRFISSSNARSD